MTKPATNSRFALLQALYWAAFCVVYSFLVPLYRSYGYDEITIGILSLVGSLATMIIQPLWGLWCDKTGMLRSIFVGSVFIAILFSFGLWLGKSGPFIIGVSVFFIASTYLVMGTILDSWIMKMANQGSPIRYNITRGFGSLSYAVVSIGFGRLLDIFGLQIIPPFFAVMALVLIFIAARTQAPVLESHHYGGSNLIAESEPLLKEHPLKAFIELLKIKKFVVFMIAIMFVFIGNGTLIVFMPLRMEELGGNNTMLGIALTIMALSEAPAMLLHHRISMKIKNEVILGISLIFFVIKILATALAPNATVLILLQALQFFAFGLYMPSAIHQINRFVGEKQLTTAMLLFASVTFGMGMMIGSSVGGVLASMVGLQMMFLIFSVVAAIGVTVFFIGGREKAMDISALKRRDE